MALHDDSDGGDQGAADFDTIDYQHITDKECEDCDKS